MFRQLRLLREHLRTELPECNWQHLSMGMTNDYTVAIEEGATLVRVGTAIFGERKRSTSEVRHLADSELPSSGWEPDGRDRLEAYLPAHRTPATSC